jgi:hypothetical protein
MAEEAQSQHSRVIGLRLRVLDTWGLPADDDTFLRRRLLSWLFHNRSEYRFTLYRTV